MKRRLCIAFTAFAAVAAPASAAAEPTIADLQRQIDELKAMVEQLKAAQRTGPGQAAELPADLAPEPTATAAAPPAVQTAETPAATPTEASSTRLADDEGRPWHERLQLRGYTQLRVNEIISGDATAPPGISRLRSVQDAGLTDRNNVSVRRARLVIQADLSDTLSVYLQPDFASAVNNQSAGERREGYLQLRDAFVDWSFGTNKDWKLRFGQQKVPFGWENMQSSSSRLPLDRSDGINSAIPGERDLGIAAYYTPPEPARVWKRLKDDGQKLFGSFGAFSVAAFNGQGVNRTETNNSLMTVAMATWPFELDGLGGAFNGQVLELGGAVMLNQVQPEIRTGGVSPESFDDNRVGVHAILYPQPFGIQAEWNWGRGPEFDQASGSIEEKRLSGGYVMAMYRVKQSALGPVIPFGRWQHYRGGWKAALNAPRLETDEFELGVEFQPVQPLEFTLSWSHTRRSEADERRTGQAEGDLLRAQLQWSY